MAKQLCKVQLNHTKDTKGTHRFDTVNPDAKKLFTCLYVNKGFFPGATPSNITVTVEVE